VVGDAKGGKGGREFGLPDLSGAPGGADKAGEARFRVRGGRTFTRAGADVLLAELGTRTRLCRVADAVAERDGTFHDAASAFGLFGGHFNLQLAVDN